MRFPLPLSSRSSSAFTLIELLTVIAIIAVLMSLLFPVAGMMKENGRKVQAKNDLMATVNAVKHYNTEYGKFPEVEETGDPTSDSYVGDPVAGLPKGINNSALYNTLRSIDREPNEKDALNPRKVVFLEAKAVTNPASPRGGVLDKASTSGASSSLQGCYFDPWGKQYNVGIDRNYDNKVELSKVYKDIKTEDSPRTGTVAFALGKDNVVGDKKSAGKIAGSDDVASWQ